MDTDSAQLADGLSRLGVLATPKMVEDIAAHLALVYATNAEMNLTAIPRDSAVVMHALDCAAALPYLSDAPSGPFADIGSGAGFPGIPLAILSGREAVLVESVRKKAVFLERVIEELCLKATVHPIRAEELALERPGVFAAVTARALSSLPSLVELASPLLMQGGRLICLKGEPDQTEIERADAVCARTGMKNVEQSRVTVPGLEAARSVVVYERRGRAQMRLPRRNGLAQRQPLA